MRRLLGMIVHHLKRAARALLGLPANAFFGIANAAARSLARAGHPIEVRGRGRDGKRFRTSDELLKHHFETRGQPGHVNFSSLRDALRLLEQRSSVILETGSSAWGTDSSRLFDAYVSCFGGELSTVDIRIEPLMKLRRSLGGRSTLVCDDSVKFLRRWVERNPGRRADLVYLDSWDLDVTDPMPAAKHGLGEFRAIQPALRDGSLLLIDDTPATPDWLPVEWRDAARAFESEHGTVPGKGMLVDRHLADRVDVTKVHHRYQTLYRF